MLQLGKGFLNSHPAPKLSMFEGIFFFHSSIKVNRMMQTHVLVVLNHSGRACLFALHSEAVVRLVTGLDDVQVHGDVWSLLLLLFGLCHGDLSLSESTPWGSVMYGCLASLYAKAR